MPGAIYWDASASWNATEHSQLYVKVNNINNYLPPPSQGGYNPTVYDVIGRMYYIGIRYHL
jgi:outer membrane receptor protein involved in Fe transport